MTATPIPRTVSMTLFGDLDVSTLRTGPAGRAPVHTYVGDESRRAKWWEFYRRKLRQGRQGYVVAPFIEGDETGEQPGIQELHRRLTEGELAGFSLGLLHGKLPAAEKEAAMRGFEEGRIQVLVATGVVEVGVDVPNATLMTIEGGERFGLAQLHQLRGRVSRGRHPGFVCLFAGPGSNAANERLEAFRSTPDGFDLAELDFRLRGPGTLFSLQQHGLPPFHIADLVRDAECVSEARADARTLVDSARLAPEGEFAGLWRMIGRRYARALELVDVG
jgi:ATP-dependent DNA helicase RecG